MPKGPTSKKWGPSKITLFLSGKPMIIAKITNPGNVLRLIFELLLKIGHKLKIFVDKTLISYNALAL
jgi:hypothetical protein